MAEDDEVGPVVEETVESMGWMTGIFWVPHAALCGQLWKGEQTYNKMPLDYL